MNIVRRNKSIALLLSAAILLTSNGFATFADTYETNDNVVDTEQVEEMSEVAEETDDSDDNDNGGSHKDGRTQSFNIDIGNGWKCASSTENSGKNTATVSVNGGKCVISANDKVPSNVDGLLTEEGCNVNIKFNGKLNSGDLFIKTDDSFYLDDGVVRGEDEKLTPSFNSIVVEIDEEYSFKGKIPEIKVYIQSPKVIEKDGAEKKVGIDEMINNPGDSRNIHQYRVRSYYPLYPVKFSLASGLGLKRINGRYAHTETIDGDDYMVFTIVPCYDENYPTMYTGKILDDCSISYNMAIPSYIGKKLYPTHYDDYFGEKYFGQLQISYNAGKHVKTIDVTKAKIVRLKNSAKSDDPYPSEVNAGIWIQQIKANSKEEKKIQKYLKKATKVKKNMNAENIMLPIIIYPYRPVAETNGIILKKGKKGYTASIHQYGKNVKLESGKKDSFKVGKNEIEFDGKTLKINTPDIWTGKDGFPAERISIK